MSRIEQGGTTWVNDDDQLGTGPGLTPPPT